MSKHLLVRLRRLLARPAPRSCTSAAPSCTSAVTSYTPGGDFLHVCSDFLHVRHRLLARPRHFLTGFRHLLTGVSDISCSKEVPPPPARSAVPFARKPQTARKKTLRACKKTLKSRMKIEKPRKKPPTPCKSCPQLSRRLKLFRRGIDTLTACSTTVRSIALSCAVAAVYALQFQTCMPGPRYEGAQSVSSAISLQFLCSFGAASGSSTARCLENSAHRCNQGRGS